MAFGLSLASCCASRKAPKNQESDLIYCSYAKSGAAGLGKEYCEFIADPGTKPKVVVALRVGNRFGDPEIHEEYSISKDEIASLAALLEEYKVKKLDGYNYEEPITGGYSYRVHVEYASGESVTFRYYGHNVKTSAINAYGAISHFFSPWVAKAEKNK